MKTNRIQQPTVTPAFSFPGRGTRGATVFALLFLLLLSARSGRGKDNTGGRITTVTVEPQRYFTETITRDKFTIRSMVPKGSSPETYGPTPQQLVSLGESEAYLRVGYIGFERSWMDRPMDNTPHIQVFGISKEVDLIFESAFDHDDHRHEGGVEPHIWNSTADALIIAGNTFKTLIVLDKENEAYYKAHYNSLCRRIEQTDSLIRRTLSVPGADHAFIIYHPAFSYFARDYGLHQISIEEGGKEPSPAHSKGLTDLRRKEEVRIIFAQSEFDRHNAEIIARQTGARVVPINPPSYDWKEETLNVARNLSGFTTE